MAGEDTATGFEAMLVIAKEQKEQLDAEREELQAQLTENGDKLRAVNAIVKTLDPSSVPAKTNGKTGNRNRVAEYVPKEERKAQMISWLSGQQGDITVAIVLQQFGWSSWHAQQMVSWARDAGLIRLSATQGNLKVYRSLVGEEA